MPEIGTRPTAFPEWATSPDDPGDVVEPSASKKEDGWIVEEPSYKFWNWLHLTANKWLEYLDLNHRIFDDLAVFVSTVADGGIAIVDEYDPTVEFLQSIGGETTGTSCWCVDGDGEWFYGGFGDQKVRRFGRDGTEVAVSSALGASVQSITADGDFVYCGSGNNVKKLNRLTLAELDTYANGATVRDVYSVGPTIYVAGDHDGTDNVKALDTDLNEDYTANVGGTTLSAGHICSNGKSVWVGHAQSGINARIAHLDDTLTSVSAGFIDQVPVVLWGLDFDDKFLYVAHSAEATDDPIDTVIRCFDQQEISEVWSYNGIGEDALSVCADGRYVYLGVTWSTGTQPHLIVFDPQTGGVVRSVDTTGSELSYGLYSDGFKLAWGLSAATLEFRVVELNAKPSLVRRCDGGDAFRSPLNQLALRTDI